MHTNDLLLDLPLFPPFGSKYQFYFIDDDILFTKESNDRVETLLLLYTVKQVKF